MKKKLISTALFVFCAYFTIFSQNSNHGANKGLTNQQKENISKEVRKTLDKCFDAMTRLNVDALMDCALQSSDFHYIDGEGNLFDYAGMKNEISQWYGMLSSQKSVVAKSEIIVVSNEVAEYISQGTLELTLKNNKVLYLSPYILYFNLKRINGVWKVFHCQESHYQPQKKGEKGLPAKK